MIGDENDEFVPIVCLGFVFDFDRACILVDLEEVILVIGQRRPDATVVDVRLIVIHRLNSPAGFRRDQYLQRRNINIDLKESTLN